MLSHLIRSIISFRLLFLFSEYIPDALETECSKCNAAQKRIAERILSTLLLNYHDIWDELLAKYDSDGIFLAKYQIPADYDYSILDLA